ncbi:MAG: dihydroflavonol-4-reductase, partial [Pseudohongiellaceae bacterium]
RRYVEAGDSVEGLLRGRTNSATVSWLRELGVRLHHGDVTQSAGLERFMDGADLLVHSAAVIGYRRRMWGEMQRVNVIGTRNVMEAARLAQVGRVVHVSSIAAVGIADTPIVLNEDSELDPDPLDAAYFDTKLAAEDEVARAVDQGLHVTTVNPGAIYGAALTPSNSSRVIASILTSPLSLIPPGGINVVPLDSVVEGVVAAGLRGQQGRRYILGGENLSLAELVQRVGLAAGRKLSPRVLPSWIAQPARAAMNCIEPFVPDSLWFTPDLCAAFGRWMWFDTTRAEGELEFKAGDLDACLRATIVQLRDRGMLKASQINLGR